MLQDEIRSDGAPSGSAAPADRSGALAGPVDERNSFWPKYRDLAEQVVGRAKEPFELGEMATPCAGETVAMATRYAIRLALREEPADPASRKTIAERAYAATATRFWADGKAVALNGQALDALLRYAVLHALNGSGIEKRWQEAAEYQAAWERTETHASVPLRAARWVVNLWPIAAGIAVGASVGMGSAFVYYFVLAP